MKFQMNRLIYFCIFAVLALIEVFIALFVRDNFIRSYIGDVLAVQVVYCFVRIIRPNGLKLLPLYVFLFAVFIEFTQYFHLMRFLGLESYRAVSIALGGTFDWIDILCYATGCLILWIFSLSRQRFSGKKSTMSDNSNKIN